MLVKKESAFLAWYFGLDLIPMLLVSLGALALVSAIMLLIFFKAPVRKGGVFGGLESIEDPEEREAMRRYVFGLDEERPLIGKEKQKAEAKAAKEAAKSGGTAEPAESNRAVLGGVMDADFEVISDEEAEETIIEEIVEEIGEAVEEVMEEVAGDADDSEETV